MEGSRQSRKKSEKKSGWRRSQEALAPPADSAPKMDPEGLAVPGEMDPQVDSLDSDFEDLFGDGVENVIVELIRSEPRFFAGQRSHGFLCHLPPGSTKESIRENFGGGVYRLNKKGAGGRIVAQRTFTIAGNPILPPAPASKEPAAPDPDSARSAVAPIQTPAGIPIGISNQEFLAMAQQLALVKSMFPDYNAELIKAVMSRPQAPQQDLIGLAGQIIGLVNQFRELAPPAAAEGSGGAGWLDIVRDAIQAFGSYLKVQAQQAPAPAPALARPMPGSFKELPAVERPALSMSAPLPPSAPAPVSAHPSAPESEAPKMSIQEFVNQAVMIICNGFLLDKPAADVVKSLEISIPLSPALRAGFLDPQRAAFRSYCETNLADDFVEQPKLAAKFGEYFEAIFEAYIHPADLAPAPLGKVE